jgi:hypothetical protein
MRGELIFSTLKDESGAVILHMGICVGIKFYTQRDERSSEVLHMEG